MHTKYRVPGLNITVVHNRQILYIRVTIPDFGNNKRQLINERITLTLLSISVFQIQLPLIKLRGQQLRAATCRESHEITIVFFV